MSDPTPAPAPAPAALPATLTSLWHTIQTNYRDLGLFVLGGLGLTIIGGLIDYVSQFFGDSTFVRLVFPALSNYFQGFAKFLGSGICATVVFMFLWRTIGHFGNHSFQEGWDDLSRKEKFYVYVGTAMCALIAASNCFAK